MRESPSRGTALQPRRYLGLELAGAKNEKTSIAALEFYPKEGKIFLLDIYDRITAHEGQSGDEALLELLEELGPEVAKMGVNVPLTLPPCFSSDHSNCAPGGKCNAPAVKWMREFVKKAAKAEQAAGAGTAKLNRLRQFTSYTQRPVELWIKHHVFSEIGDFVPFEVDEALGGNKAPLTARMNFLQRFLEDMALVEVWPKLTVSILAKQLGIGRRVLMSYRHLEEGVHSRTEILEAISHELGVFIYERDMRKLANNLPSFDAFICAYTALLCDAGGCMKAPHGFPVASGWVEHPKIHA